MKKYILVGCCFIDVNNGDCDWVANSIRSDQQRLNLLSFEGTEIHLPILMVNYLFYFAFDLDNYILERCHFVVSAHSTGQKNVTFRV